MSSDTSKSCKTKLNVGSVGASTPLSKGDKREASSPLDAADTDSKKIRHHSSASNTSLMDDNDDASTVHVLSQPIHPLDIVNIAKELHALMLPEMANIIKSQLPDIQKIVKESTDTLSSEIQALRDENAKLSAENTKLWGDVEKLTTRITKAENDNDALEQYTRRNSLPISGIPETEHENTDTLVYKLANQLNSYIGPTDIDRSHRVGKPKNGGRHRDIIVKFATYNARQKLYQNRMDLRNSEDEVAKGIFINEDLTKIRSKLLYDSRTLVRVDKLKSAYSSDGKIFVRDLKDDRHLIKTGADILKFGDPEEVKKILAARVKAKTPKPTASSLD